MFRIFRSSVLEAIHILGVIRKMYDSTCSNWPLFGVQYLVCIQVLPLCCWSLAQAHLYSSTCTWCQMLHASPLLKCFSIWWSLNTGLAEHRNVDDVTKSYLAVLVLIEYLPSSICDNGACQRLFKFYFVNSSQVICACVKTKCTKWQSIKTFLVIQDWLSTRSQFHTHHFYMNMLNRGIFGAISRFTCGKNPILFLCYHKLE